MLMANICYYGGLNGWGRRKGKSQLPRSTICLTNFVDCLRHSAAVNWIRKVKGKQSGTDWSWVLGLAWNRIVSDRIGWDEIRADGSRR